MFKTVLKRIVPVVVGLGLLWGGAMLFEKSLIFFPSTDDEIVPYEMGWRLFDAAAEPKSFYELVGAGHNQTLAVGGSRYLKTIGGFLDTLPDETVSTAGVDAGRDNTTGLW